MVSVSPFIYPSSRKPWKNAWNRGDGDCAVPGSNVRKQSRGVFLRGCPCAACHHVTAPPSSVMKSRRRKRPSLARVVEPSCAELGLFYHSGIGRVCETSQQRLSP